MGQFHQENQLDRISQRTPAEQETRNRLAKLITRTRQARDKYKEEAKQQERIAKKNEEIAIIDTLTGVYSRFYLHGWKDEATGQTVLGALDRAKIKADRNNTPLTIIYVDLNSLKGINDSPELGHDAGDYALKIVGKRIQSAIRTGVDTIGREKTDSASDEAKDENVVGREGGDEFVMLLENGKNSVPLDEGVKVAERICENFQAPVTYGGQMLNLSVSIGVAEYRPSCSPNDIRAVLKEADKATYVAKKNKPLLGGNICYFNEINNQKVPVTKLCDRPA